MSAEETYDDYFETELRKNLREGAKSNIDFRMIPLGGTISDDDSVSRFTKDVYHGLDEVLDAFFYAKLGEDTDYDTIADLTEEFMGRFTDKNIAQMYKQHHFTDEELDFMRYTTSTHKWRGKREIGIGASYALRDILLREEVIREFGEDALPQLKMAAENLPGNYGFSEAKKHFSGLFSKYPYGKKLKESLEEAIDVETEYSFNNQMNCGGYAFKVDTWVDPTYCRTTEKKIAALISKFPFVRLLHDGKVADDEYLVFYRTDENCGNHFIRVDSDGIVREKDSNKPPQVFKCWSKDLEGAYETEFAVKKNHRMFGYKLLETNTCDRNLKVPAEVIEYVNTPRTRVPIIRDGRLMNYSDYVQAPTMDKDIGDDEIR
ncbi:MAG: hypothetical protein K6D97_00980 [Clostridia bacterium]|nr:hypothetical protein [Clostridia bacterium]